MKKPLDRFPILRTRDADEMRAALKRTYLTTGIVFPEGDADFLGHINYVRLKDLALSYCSYAAPILMNPPEADFVRLQFGLAGRATSIFTDTPVHVDERCCAIVNAQTKAVFKLERDFEQVILRIPQALLERKLAAINGAPAHASLVFQQDHDLNSSQVSQIKNLVWFLIQSLDENGLDMPATALVEIEQMIATMFLLRVPHSASPLFEKPINDIAPWQVRRVEEYIAANWSQPITVEQIAEIINASARSIFKTFADYRGYSPMEFLRKVRLDQAHAMLMNPESRTTVTAVGLACGFINLGHFARYYQQAFGELPSETLVRVKRGQRAVSGSRQ